MSTPTVCILARVSGILAIAWAPLALAQGHWAYDGKGGPDSWGEDCRTGKQQSPIDIARVGASAAKTKELPTLTFRWKQSKGEVINNGHTIQVNVERGDEIQVGPTRYALLQFHFHTPSEHRFDGRTAPMEAHFVHRGSDGKLAVVGIMMHVAGKNEVLSPVFTKLPRTPSVKRPVTLDLANILPSKQGYYTYEGSLTTPPCTENVRWILLKDSISISSTQYKAFTTVFKNNARPPQSLNGREVAVAQE